MQFDRFFIGQYNQDSGLQEDLKPFMIPDQAFAQLNNAYVFRGRVRKRFGSRWLGSTQQSTRLRVAVATTNASGNASGTVPGTQFNVGQMFSIGNVLFTVDALGTPANLLVSGGTAGTATFNTTTGAFVFAGVSVAPTLTVVYWYPALPVMGLITFENAPNNNEATIAFDTQFSYQYDTGTMGWEMITGFVTAGANVWTGNNAQFFWGASYSGVNAFDYVLFVTNFNAAEPNFMRFLLNSTFQWDNFRPQLSSTGPLFLDSALILIPFKNRLLAFNTIENNNGTQNQYPNRMRYSAIGSPLAADAWRQDIPGNGGGRDCPNNENIVTVEFVKDRLIVFLEESTWEIVYTNNQISPFAWQQINTEFGVEGTFSVVPFDKVAIGVGNIGVIACTGTNVDRIDEKIPDEVFEIHNTDSGPARVYGIRDYYTEMVYWTFPDVIQSATFPYPNRVFVYNYKNGCWAFNDDSFTVFGYFQPQTANAVKWNSNEVYWDDSVSWDSGSLSALFRNVIAGNQEGWTFLISPDFTSNDYSLQITQLSVAAGNRITITSIDHNQREQQYVLISGITNSGMGDNLTLLNGQIFQVMTIIDANNFTITYPSTMPVLAGTYSGGGIMARVSQIQVLTKQFNFYLQKGRNFYIPKVDFLVDATVDGQIEVNYFVSTNQTDMITASSAEPLGTGTLLGTGNLETFPYPTVPFEKAASQLWHPIYLQADGEFIQINIELNDAQMRNILIRDEDFQLHAMIFSAVPTASRLQ